MSSSALKRPTEESLTPESIKAMLASTPSNRLYYRDIRAALPHERSAMIIKLLVETQRKKQIVFDNNLLVSLPG